MKVAKEGGELLVGRGAAPAPAAAGAPTAGAAPPPALATAVPERDTPFPAESRLPAVAPAGLPKGLANGEDDVGADACCPGNGALTEDDAAE